MEVQQSLFIVDIGDEFFETCLCRLHPKWINQSINQLIIWNMPVPKLINRYTSKPLPSQLIQELIIALISPIWRLNQWINF